jgi:gliding motility-associated-like protein
MITVDPSPTAEAGTPQSICTGQSATLVATGGGTYQWSTGSTTSTINVNPVSTTTYSVTVTSNGCSATDNVMITVNPLPNVQITSFSDASCGANDGSAIASGGISYLWSNGQTTASITGLAPNNYSVTATDINGCIADTNVTIGQISAPSATASSTNENCNQSNGIATVVASGGTGNYAYTWSTNPQQTTATATGLPADTYTVTVTDGSNCSATTSAIILPIPGPTASFTAFPMPVHINETISFLDNSNGNIVSWQWNFDDGSQETGTSINHQYTTPGKYTVTLVVTDNSGCLDSYSDTITVKNHFILSIPNAFSPDGDGLNDSFFPVGEGIDPNNYDMKIFDRWGNILFHTTDMNEPWKGTLNNNETANKVTGVYVYRIIVKEINGSEYEFTGSITLLK